MHKELDYLDRLSVTDFSELVTKLNDNPTIESIGRRILNMKIDEETKKLAFNVLENTIQSVIVENEKDAFVITGDIPAMWLRDSACQLKPFIKYLAEDDKQLRNIIRKVIRRQVQSVLLDPYANAFNLKPDKDGHFDDNTEMKEGVWERKYEIDSLCYPVELAYLYFKKTEDKSIFDDDFIEMMKVIVRLFITEQNHEEQSEYRFQRNMDLYPDLKPENETLSRDGLGTKAAYTGLIWSGFRPSDDACRFHYLIPSNCFALVVLGYMLDIIKSIDIDDSELVQKIQKLKSEVSTGIERFGIKEGIMMYEVDGMSHSLFSDDANVPSLLSLPYLNYCSEDDDTYRSTREKLLSDENPCYYAGTAAAGIGSEHTKPGNVWPIALCIEGLTINDRERKREILEILTRTHGGTYLMHESFNKDDPGDYTRPWFSWANVMFMEFLLSIGAL